MVSKSPVHAARTSPLPGFVVIVLAVGAILFGLAVVQRPRAQDDLLQAQLVRLRVELAELQDRTAVLERALVEETQRRR